MTVVAITIIFLALGVALGVIVPRLCKPKEPPPPFYGFGDDYDNQRWPKD